MRTMRELAELIKDREADLAYGSETGLLGVFVHEHGHVQDCMERGDDVVSEEEFQAWADAYDRMEQLEADGEDYDIGDLF